MYRLGKVLNRSIQLLGFIITGAMLLCTIQALGELAVLYPVNGAFYTYFCRFLDPAWYAERSPLMNGAYWNNIHRGFAIGWDYAISWLTILPFELIAASLTIQYWRTDINVGVWITVFLVVLIAIQFFGVRGYGEGILYILLNLQNPA